MYRKGFTIAVPNNVTGSDFEFYKYIKILEEAMVSDTDNLIEKVRDIYGSKVKNGQGKVSYNVSEKPDVTFTASGEDDDIISGKLNPQEALQSQAAGRTEAIRSKL